jgi:hypothetical protein
LKILKVLSRIYLVDTELNSVISFYERLLDEPCKLRFTHPVLGLELAQIGSVLLIAGPEEKMESVRSTQLTILVDSLKECQDLLKRLGAEVIEGPNRVPTGSNMRVRHPDGIIVEYVEHHA